MKASFVISALVAVVAATTSETPTTTATALTPTQSCLNACTPGDVTCQAICVGVPHPGASQMNATTNCVAQCDQGDGSTAASDAYAKCRDACISSYIILSGTAAPGGAYTTAIPAGVSNTEATATGTATGSGASGMMTTITILVPVAEEYRTRYDPPFETMTVEVHPFPMDLLDCQSGSDCDGPITLSSGQSQNGPTGRLARPSSTESHTADETDGLSTGSTSVTEQPVNISVSLTSGSVSGSLTRIATPGASVITITYIRGSTTVTTVVPLAVESTRIPSSIVSRTEWNPARLSPQPGGTTAGVPVQTATQDGKIGDISTLTQVATTTIGHPRRPASQTGSKASSAGAAASTSSSGAGMVAAQIGITGGLAGLFLGAFALL